MMRKASKIDKRHLPPILQRYNNYIASLLASSTRKDYLYGLMRFHEFLLHKRGKSIEHMVRYDVEAYMTELTLRKERGEIKQCFVKQEAKIIKTYAEWLMDEEILDSKEFYKIERYLEKIPGGDTGEDREALSDEDVKQVFKKLTDVLFTMISWAGLNFGFRRLEYCNLRVKHLELDRKEPRLKIERSKGRKKKTRYIPLFPGQVVQWRKWLDFIASLNLPHDFVFYNPKNPSLELTKNVLSSTLFPRMSRITGVHLYSHILRYTYATRLWEAEVDIYIISYLLGHSKVETTVRYLKVSERNFRQKFMKSAKGLFG